MIDREKVRAIAHFEFMAVVKRWSYVIATFILPLTIAGVSGATILVQSYFLAQRTNEMRNFGLVDEAGMLAEVDLWKESAGATELSKMLGKNSLSFTRFEDQRKAIEALKAKKVHGVYVITKDYLETGTVRTFRPSTGPLVDIHRSTVEPALVQALRKQLIKNRGEELWATRVLSPVAFEHSQIDSNGAIRASGDQTAEFLGRTTVPVLLGVLLLTALLGASGYLVQTIAQDKETKIVEVLLSSARSDEILMGKLVGLGAAGLLQFAVWSAMIVVVAIGIALGAAPSAIPWFALAFSPVYFCLGYLFMGSLMLATASLGNNAAESQKLTMVWAALALIPLMLLLVLLDAPHGVLAQVFSWVPFTSPLTMVLRLAVDAKGVAPWEIAGSIAVLLCSTWFAIRIGARLFRVGLLLNGSRPSIKSLWAQARLLK